MQAAAGAVAGGRSGQWECGKAEDVLSRLATDFTGREHDSAKFEREFERAVKVLRADEDARGEPTKIEL